MSTPIYQVGEHVQVILDARVEAASPAGTILSLSLLDGEEYGSIELDPRAPGIKIARVTPADGEPQPGDLWADRSGDEWFAIRKNTASVVWLYAVDGRSYTWQHIHNDAQMGPIHCVRSGAPIPAVPQHEELPV